MTTQYPPFYSRLSNFNRDAMAGLESPAPAKLDAELNAIQTTLRQECEVMRGITTADGHLRNVSLAIAQSLVGSWIGTAPVSPGPIVTTIPWVSTMSNLSVLVMLGTVVLNPNQFTVAAGGVGSAFLTVTPTSYPATGTTTTVWAFEPGSGLLTRLASTANGDGAALIAIHDAGSFFASTDVENALQEVGGTIVSLQASLGPVADYFKRDGSVAATGNFDMAGFQLHNNADGTADGDLVTVRQIAAYVAAWTDLSRFFLKRDGTAAMAGALNFGNNKGLNLADPDLGAPLDAVNVRTLLKTIATSGAAPVGSTMDFYLTEAPANWLFCDGQAYLGTAYPILFAGLPAAFRTGSAQGAIAASLPALVGANLSVPAGPGVITSIPAMSNQGVGYTGLPQIRVVNPTQYPAPTLQPTFTVTVTPTTIAGPNVAGGVLTVALLTGGTGIYPGAVIIIDNALAASPGSPALAQLPTGYFRTPDRRGRVSLGAGTESKSPGIVDPPDVTKGDSYNATPHTIGQYGGEEKHQLTVAELARHGHAFGTQTRVQLGTDNGESYGVNTNSTNTDLANHFAGTDTAHNTLPPYLVCNVIIKAA